MREIVRVQTPENVPFEFELAGLGTRAMAWALDVGVMAVIVVAAAQVLVSLTGLFGGFATALVFVVAFLVQWWYSALTEWAFGGRTLGKWMLGLRVLDERGLRIGFQAAALRNLLRVVDFLPGLYLVGGTWSLLDPRRRRLGDLAAGTLVVRERGLPPPSALGVATGDAAADPAVVLALRRMTAPEHDAILALALRREDLPVAVRLRLFAELAELLEAHLALPRPEHISPERYVLGIGAAALRAR